MIRFMADRPKLSEGMNTMRATKKIWTKSGEQKEYDFYTAKVAEKTNKSQTFLLNT